MNTVYTEHHFNLSRGYVTFWRRRFGADRFGERPFWRRTFWRYEVDTV